MKNCIKCNQLYDLTKFRTYSSGNKSSTCTKCSYQNRKLSRKKNAITVTEKKCYCCKLIKKSNEFHKNADRKDGLSEYCKECRKPKLRGYYLENIDSKRLKSKERYYRNKISGVKRKRKKKTPKPQLVRRLRNRLYYAIRKKEWKKDTHFSKYIGCSKDELMLHIEKQFEYGMTWDNMKMWHIDHITPLSSAKNEDELYMLCHYTNLRPMWAKENMSKGNKTPFQHSLTICKYELIEFIKNFKEKFGGVVNESTLTKAAMENPQFLADFITQGKIKNFTKALAVSKLGLAVNDNFLGLIKSLTRDPSPLVREGAYKALSEYFLADEEKYADLYQYFKESLETETGEGVKKQIGSLLAVMEMYK